MSDELKPCAHCGKEAKMMLVDDEYNPYYWVECVLCHVQTDAYCEKDDAIAAWNRRADDAQVIKNAESYKLADDCKPQVIPDGEKHESTDKPDSRERLEADAETLLFEFGHYCATSREGLSDDVYVFIGDFTDLLDRQAAITEREVKLRELYKFEENHREHIRSIEEVNQKLNDRIDELIAERDELERANSRQARKIHDVCEINEKLTAERNKLDEDCSALDKRCIALEERADSLTAERDQLSRDLDAEHALVVQFEHDNEELRHANNTLRASVAGLKMTVDRLTGREPADMGN